MTHNYFDNACVLRARIAAAAARMIAQEGLDYQSAKHKAARQISGAHQGSHNILPDNSAIENELRLYNELFLSSTQPARLFQLRTLALQLMKELAQFHPFLTGAVLNGTAGMHAQICLQLFAPSAKEVQLFLLNKNIVFDLSETPHFKGARHAPVETVSFLWLGEGVHAVLYEHDDLRGALKLKNDGKVLRADANALRTLLDASK